MVVRPTDANRRQIRGMSLDTDPVDLDRLSGGEIGVPRPEDPAVTAVRSLPEGVGHHPDLANLRGGEESPRDLDPHHVGIPALLLGVDPCPLQPFQLAGHLGDGGRALFGVGVDDGGNTVQGMPVELLLLDLVELAVSAIRVDKRHGAVGAPNCQSVEFVAIFGHLSRAARTRACRIPTNGGPVRPRPPPPDGWSAHSRWTGNPAITADAGGCRDRPRSRRCPGRSRWPTD